MHLMFTPDALRNLEQYWSETVNSNTLNPKTVSHTFHPLHVFIVGYHFMIYSLRM